MPVSVERDVEVHYTTPAVLDDEQDVEQPESSRGHGEEVHRRNPVVVAPQEGDPAPRPVRI